MQVIIQVQSLGEHVDTFSNTFYCLSQRCPIIWPTTLELPAFLYSRLVLRAWGTYEIWKVHEMKYRSTELVTRTSRRRPLLIRYWFNLQFVLRASAPPP